jgi:hypothetical protein
MPGGSKPTPNFDFENFEGFAAPGSTQVPDVFFDKIMVHLPDVELRVLLYFFRRTFGFKKFSDNISISQMTNGIQTRDGKTLDYGCGLSKSGVTKGLRGLLRKNLIVATRRSDAKHGNLPTNYALNMRGVHRHGEDPAVGHEGDEDEITQRRLPLSSDVDKGVSPPVHKGGAQRGQPLSPAVDTQDTVTNLQTDKVVNPTNDHRNRVRDRASIGREHLISDRALRSRYKLSDPQIGRVHWLVDRQIEILSSADRNHANYVKRAAEAVQAGDDALLDRMLGELKQTTRAIAVASRPAYFHRMYAEALEHRRAGAALASRDAPRGFDLPAGLFGPSQDDPSIDPRTRIITDAEHRGFSVPDYIRNADIAAVSQWWAGLDNGPRNA